MRAFRRAAEQLRPDEGEEKGKRRKMEMTSGKSKGRKKKRKEARRRGESVRRGQRGKMEDRQA